MKLNSDGVFIIQKGQGLTQALAKEIGLSQEQEKKLDNSIWTKIMEEVDKQKAETPDLYSGGNDINGEKSENYIVKTGQVITISLAGVWDKILDIVNNSLGTNFKKVDKEDDYDQIMASKENQVKPQGAHEKNDDILKFKNELPNLENANKFVKQNDGTTIYYDKNGYMKVHLDKDNKSIISVSRDNNGNIKNYTMTERDKNGEEGCSITRDTQGQITAIIIPVEANGTTIYHSVENNSVISLNNIIDAHEYNKNEKGYSVDSLPEIYKKQNEENANKFVKQNDGTTIYYDKNGYMKAHLDKDNKSIISVSRDNDGSIKNYTMTERDKNGEEGCSITRDAQGQIIAIIIPVDANGTTIYHSVENNSVISLNNIIDAHEYNKNK